MNYNRRSFGTASFSVTSSLPTSPNCLNYPLYNVLAISQRPPRTVSTHLHRSPIQQFIIGRDATPMTFSYLLRRRRRRPTINKNAVGGRETNYQRRWCNRHRARRPNRSADAEGWPVNASRDGDDGQDAEDDVVVAAAAAGAYPGRCGEDASL